MRHSALLALSLLAASSTALADGIVICLAPPPVTVIVDTADDIVADDGLTSLREAVAQAKANLQCGMNEYDVVSINLPADTVLTLADAIVIDDDKLQITSSNPVTVRGSNADAPLFSITRNVVDTRVTLSRMLLDGESVLRSRPAIYAGSQVGLKLDRMIVRDFNGGGAAPGALDADGVIGLSIDDCLFVYNSGANPLLHGGGAVSLSSDSAGGLSSVFQVFRSSFLANESAGADNAGGALLALLPGGAPLSVIASTFAFNSTGGDGGAIAHAGGLLQVVNSTISGNVAADEGGGVYFSGAGMTLAHSTLVDNSARLGGGVSGAVDAGLAVAHSILSINSASDGGANVNAVTTTLDHSLVDVDAGLLRLNELALDGGSTLTHLPQADSVAIDAGDASAIGLPELDQRGQPRVLGSAVDIGAVETAPVVETAPAAVAAGDSGGAADLFLLVLLGLRGIQRVARRR